MYDLPNVWWYVCALTICTLFPGRKNKTLHCYFLMSILLNIVLQHQNINDKTKTSVLLNHVLKINRHHLFSMCIYSNQCFCLQHCCEPLVVMGILQTRDAICPAEFLVVI